jgi:hypothetical protein
MGLAARFLSLPALAAGLLFLSARGADADPGAGPWVNTVTGAADTVVNFDEQLRYSITDATESQLFSVTTPKADLCFDPHTGATGGAARVSVYRPVNPATATINGSILLPAVPSDNSDCIVLVRGLYWVEVTTGPGGGETPVVTVTGRGN